MLGTGHAGEDGKHCGPERNDGVRLLALNSALVILQMLLDIGAHGQLRCRHGRNWRVAGSYTRRGRGRVQCAMAISWCSSFMCNAGAACEGRSRAGRNSCVVGAQRSKKVARRDAGTSTGRVSMGTKTSARCTAAGGQGLPARGGGWLLEQRSVMRSSRRTPVALPRCQSRLVPATVGSGPSADICRASPSQRNVEA